jgi:hypothetical protein
VSEAALEGEKVDPVHAQAVVYGPITIILAQRQVHDFRRGEGPIRSGQAGRQRRQRFKRTLHPSSRAEEVEE